MTVWWRAAIDDSWMVEPAIRRWAAQSGMGVEPAQIPRDSGQQPHDITG